MQPHAGSFLADTRYKIRPEVFHEAFAGSQCERSDESCEIELLRRAQDRLTFLHDLTDPFTKFDRSRRGHEAAAGSYQEWIARRLTQSRQRPAHRRRAEAQPLGGAGDTAFRQ